MLDRPERSEIIVRGQSNVWRLPKYWPPIPLTARRVCTPPPPPAPAFGAGGGHTRWVEEGGGRSKFWKTSDTALYSTCVSTLWTWGRGCRGCIWWRCLTVGRRGCPSRCPTSPRRRRWCCTCGRNKVRFQIPGSITMETKWCCYIT